MRQSHPSKRSKSIRRYCCTAGRKLDEIDFLASAVRAGHYLYANDPDLVRIVERLTDNPQVRRIDIPRLAVAQYRKGGAA